MSTTDTANVVTVADDHGRVGTVTLPAGWRAAATDGTEAIALPVDLAQYTGHGFVPNVTIRLGALGESFDPASMGSVLSDASGEHTFGGGYLRSVVGLNPLGDQPLVQLAVVLGTDAGELVAVATATAAQWPTVAADFDRIGPGLRLSSRPNDQPGGGS